MQRYFVSIINNKVILSDLDFHHITHVMRFRVGDKIEVVNNSKAYIASIKNINPLEVEIIEEISENPELNYKITLFYALAKGEKIEFVIQKASELGADKVVLVKCKSDVVKMNQDDFIRKLDRYKLIAKEASEQSHRNKIIEIDGIYDVNKIPSNLICSLNYVAYEKMNMSEPDFSLLNLLNKGESVSLFVGSEGGISKDEFTSLLNQGFKPISLGKRILRTETAAVYGLSVISYLLEKK